LITGILRILQLAIIIRAIISWIPMRPNKFTYYLTRITEPMIGPIRKLIFRIPMMQQVPVDISPVIAYFILTLISRVVSQLYYYSLF